MSKILFAFRLRRFLALAPSLFRQDAVFRYAVIGGGLALLALLSRLGDAPTPVPAPASALPPVAQSLSAPVPPPASLGTEYGAAPESKRPPEPVSHDPPRIAPSHSLDELGAAQNRRPAPDRFGVIPRASSEKN
ncbi:MAG: hypothetical protein WA733_14525 [Methylocystis sp.]